MYLVYEDKVIFLKRNLDSNKTSKILKTLFINKLLDIETKICYENTYFFSVRKKILQNQLLTHPKILIILMAFSCINIYNKIVYYFLFYKCILSSIILVKFVFSYA